MGSKKPQTSTTENSPWKPAQGALENILNNAGNLFDSQGGINAEWIDKNIADLNPEMQQAIKDFTNTDKFQQMAQGMGNAIQQGVSGIGQATGTLGGLTQQGISGEDINKLAQELYQGELVQSQKGQLGKEIESGLDKSVQQLNQQSAGSGNMGSSRAGVAQGVMTGEAADAYASGAAAIENSAIQNAIGQAMGTLQGNQQTALGAAGQLGNIGMSSLGQMGNLSNIYNQGLQNQMTGAGILQQYQQGVLNNQWFNQQGQQNMGWDQLNKYLNIAGSIGGMGGTSTTTQPGKGSGGALGALGTIGGAVAGGMMGGVGGAQLGAQVGGSLGGFSDARLKDDVTTVTEAREGLPRIVGWVWNDLAHALFKEQGFTAVPPAYGVIAQEMEELGMSSFVEHVDTNVEGLDGSVRLVNYMKLMEHAREIGAITA